MTNHICLPDPRLIAEVDSYTIAYDASPSIPYYPASRLAFNLGGADIQLDGQRYTAPILFCISDDANMRTLDHGPGEIVIIHFQGGAFYRLFGLDAGEHGGTVIEAGHNQFNEFNGLSHALAAASPTLKGRVETLDQVLLTLIDTARPYGLGEKFRFMALHSKGEMRVEDAARRLGVSVRTLERDCRKRFGRTPKRIMRGYRLHAALVDFDRDHPLPRWADFDGAQLYSDQSHFLRDSRDIGGMTFRQYQALAAAAPDNWLYHVCGDLEEGSGAPYQDVKAQFDENLDYFPFSAEVAAQLGVHI